MLQSASKRYNIISVPNIYLEEEGKPCETSLLIGKDGESKAFKKWSI